LKNATAPRLSDTALIVEDNLIIAMSAEVIGALLWAPLVAAQSDQATFVFR
jgi:hypothetical protein